MSEEPRTLVIRLPRRSTVGGSRRALPVRAALAVLALCLIGAGAVLAAPASGKFCGFDMTKKVPQGGQRRLENVAYLHTALDFHRPYERYVRRPAIVGGYNGFILWGHTQEAGFKRLYFVAHNVETSEC